ncbi:MAG: radical SAM protein [Candidatus Omnitrophota bacterium]
MKKLTARGKYILPINRYIINFRYAFRPRKPLLILRLFSTYLKILFLKAKPLRYIDFAIDYGCNMRCEHCFATALEKKDKEAISPAQFGQIVKNAMKLGALNFSFQGGEPTLFPKLFDYIKMAQPRNNLISVTTNGSLLTEDMIDKLKKAYVDILTISLDSGIPKEHDDFRRSPGSFSKALEGIKLALKNKMNVTIGTTVTHGSLYSEGFIKLIDMAHELNVIVFAALAAPLGRWEDNSKILIRQEDREYINSLSKKYPLFRTDFEANYVNYGCGAVKEILYITPYGDVLACPYLHFSLGNILKESLRNIRERALRNPYFKDYYKLCLAAEDRYFIKTYSISSNKITGLL